MQVPKNVLEAFRPLGQDVIVPVAQSAETVLGQMSGSGMVFGDPLGMLSAVHFDDQLRLEAHEVQYVGPEGKLTPELHPKLPATKAGPQGGLGICRLLAQRACECLRVLA
ncbi:hypothetical protein IP84_14440 [beta proteobacterium AAP99]|nr:hypothetical protein IP84_14440 [beta proteobacterium AAP99]